MNIIFTNSHNAENVLSQDEHMLAPYLHYPLVQFLEKLLGIESVEDGTRLERHKKHLKVETIIAIMCSIKNSKCVLLQTMLGLSAYACGLRDHGFHLLIMFGVLCGIKHIRNEAAEWSQKRRCTDELDKSSFWRVTFDNLDFERKFAKTFQAGGEVLGRMLNLITGQVSHRELAGASTEVDSSHCPAPATSADPRLTVDDFFMHNRGNTKSALVQYVDNLIAAEINRLGKEPKDLKSTLIEDLQEYMPHCTPTRPDRIVYATVLSAQSASVDDVSKYLNLLKDDLRIGEEGYPAQVVVGGDQQTYALIKNLMGKFPTTFSWIIPVPGDWHLLKCAAESIRDMLWDGGLHQLAMSCQHMKDITQWKDVHRMLSAVHEALLHEVLSSAKINDDNDLSTWLEEKMADEQDDVLRFWAQTVYFLNAYMEYYYSIRTGSYHLRNACLPAISELFTQQVRGASVRDYQGCANAASICAASLREWRMDG